MKKKKKPVFPPIDDYLHITKRGVKLIGHCDGTVYASSLVPRPPKPSMQERFPYELFVRLLNRNRLIQLSGKERLYAALPTECIWVEAAKNRPRMGSKVVGTRIGIVLRADPLYRYIGNAAYAKAVKIKPDRLALFYEDEKAIPTDSELKKLADFFYCHENKLRIYEHPLIHPLLDWPTNFCIEEPNF
ncbi:MAG: hypothetical protein ACK5X3_09915 [Pseudomonadota bacterium]|jgi:hypothetical protein